MKPQETFRILKFETSQLLNQETTLFKSPYWSDSYYNPYNPDRVYNKRGSYAIYTEMRDDDQVKAAMSVKKHVTLNSGWEFNQNQPNELVDYCYELFESKIEKPIDQSLMEMLTAFEYGFSITEIIPKLEGGTWWLKYLKTRAPDSFEIEVDKFGNIIHFWQQTDQGRLDVPINQVLHFVHNGEYDNPFGKSDLNACYLAYQSKKYAIKFFNISLERHASTKIVAFYPPSFDDKRKQDLYDNTKDIQFGSTLIIPEGVKLEFPNNPDASEVYKKAIDEYNIMIARAILIPDLLGISGSENRGGSYALGQTQYDVFLKTLEHTRNHLARLINNKIIKPLIYANFGKTDDLPRFCFKPLKEIDNQRYITLWLDAVKSKVYKPNPEEIEYFRDEINFPNGPVLEPDKPQLPIMPIKEEIKEEPKEEIKVKESEEPKETKETPETKELAKFRAPNRFEKKVDFKKIKRDLDEFDAKGIEGLIRITDKMINEFIDRIENNKILEKAKVDKISALDLKYKKEMKLYLKDFFSKVYEQAQVQGTKEIFNQAEFKTLTPEEIFLEALDAESYDYVEDYTALLTSRAKTTLYNGIKAGTPAKKLAFELRNALKEATSAQVERYIRTKNTETYNKARYFLWTENKNMRDVIAAFEFSAIIDADTTDRCLELDGLIADKDDPVWDKITPPLHFNCRSLLIPITRFEDYEIDDKKDISKWVNAAKEMPGGTLGGIEQFIPD